MRVLSILAIIGLLFQASAVAEGEATSLCEDDDNPHFENPCQNEVDEFDRTPDPTEKPSAQPTTTPSVSPSVKPSHSPSASPSYQPSMTPSASPSSAPSWTPSVNPSHTPSTSPSSKPSQKPSTSPSIHPSASPTIQISKNPTASPSNQPTTSPSSSPSYKPSASPSSTPSLSPSSSPSFAPTRADCETTDGVFGAVDGESVSIDFAYELHVSGEDQSNLLIQDNILPSLEKSIIDSILPAIFKDECDRSNGRRLRFQRRLEVIGISQYPDDIIYDDLVCTTTVDGGNQSDACVVVSGELTLYSSGNETTSSEEDLVKAAIKAAMNSGSLDDSHSDIVKVTFLDVDPKANINSATGGDYGSVNDSTLLYAIGGALLGALLVLAVIYRQKKRRGKDEATTNTQMGASAVTQSVLVEQGNEVEISYSP